MNNATAANERTVIPVPKPIHKPLFLEREREASRFSRSVCLCFSIIARAASRCTFSISASFSAWLRMEDNSPFKRACSASFFSISLFNSCCKRSSLARRSRSTFCSASFFKRSNSLLARDN